MWWNVVEHRKGHMALVLPYFLSYTRLLSALWEVLTQTWAVTPSHTSMHSLPPMTTQFWPQQKQQWAQSGLWCGELYNLTSMRPWKGAPGESLTLTLWSCSVGRDVTELVPKQDPLKKKEPRQGSCCLGWWAVLNRNNSAKRKIWISATLKIFFGIVNFMCELGRVIG